MNDVVTFVYDGECPICKAGVNNFCVRKDAGTLERVNKRQGDAHPVIQEIREQQLNLDSGMVIKYKGAFYQGPEALHIMSKIGENRGWAGKISGALFRYKWLAYLSYPFIRGARNLLIRLKGVGKINNLES